MKPLLLIIRTGKQEFREYLLRSITQQYRVHMFMTAAPSWELEYAEGCTRLDCSDVQAMIAAAKELQSNEHIAGVLSWDEAHILHATELAAALGLPGEPGAVARCRDKLLTRQALAAAGVAQPESVRVDTLPDALVEAGRIGYPVIIKPTDLALSAGVVRVETAEQLAEAWDYVSNFKHGGLPNWRPTILLEEFASGYEISVDTAVHRGELFPLCLARKEIGFAPYCVEVGHTVHADDPLLQDPTLMRLLHDTHRALGYTDGMTHTEIMVTASGPKIIEVNARLGGDMIPYLGLRATGVDTGLAAAAVACGRIPQVVRSLKQVAGVRFFYPPAPETAVTSIEFDFGGEPPKAIDMLTLIAAPGEVKSPPPAGIVNGRTAFATAVADTAEEVKAALDAAEAALRLNHR